MWKISSLIQRRLNFVCTACFSCLHFLYITESVGVEPGIVILSPVVTSRMGLQRSEKCQKGLRDVTDRKAGLSWGLCMKKSTLQVRLNGRVTFDRRIEVPSLSSFFKLKNEEKQSFADWLIELANRGFGISTDAFLKISERKFPRHWSTNYTI